jgi:alkylation response protein AidB-like acyl-CoA dehydrogenase
VDDWDGMGQRLTASGTSHFVDVPVEDAEVVKEDGPFAYSQAFYQLVHLATLAGIGRAASEDVAAAVASRRRTYSHAAATRPAEDPQVLQVVGRVRSAAYGAGAVVLNAAEALEAAFEEGKAGNTSAALAANAVAQLETWQAQAVVTDLILESTAIVFDALGASATLRPAGLDRYWRNARTISSHNPRIYKDRIVGDFAVNGTLPPPQWPSVDRDKEHGAMTEMLFNAFAMNTASHVQHELWTLDKFKVCKASFRCTRPGSSPFTVLRMRGG